jgi:hypothetical protein
MLNTGLSLKPVFFRAGVIDGMEERLQWHRVWLTEQTAEDGPHLVEDHRTNQAIDDVPYDPQARWHAVPHNRRVGARV